MGGGRSEAVNSEELDMLLEELDMLDELELSSLPKQPVVTEAISIAAKMIAVTFFIENHSLFSSNGIPRAYYLCRSAATRICYQWQIFLSLLHHF